MEHAEFGTLGYAQINALSWRVASELSRRDPAVYIGLTGYEGSSSDADALILTNGRDIRYHARRRGSGFVALRQDRDWCIPWKNALQMGSAREIAKALEASVGVDLPAKSPATSRRALGYRVVASMLEISLGDCRSWTVNEMEGGPLDEGVAVEQRLRLNEFEDTRWALLRDESTVATVDNLGFVNINGRHVDLLARYQALNRSLFALTLDTFRGVLP